MIGCQSIPAVPALREAIFGWSFETGASLRFADSWRRMPEADTIVWPGNRRFSSLQITAVFSSDVQNRIEGVDHGRMTFTQDRSAYRSTLFDQRTSQRSIMSPALRRTTTSAIPSCAERRSHVGRLSFHSTRPRSLWMRMRWPVWPIAFRCLTVAKASAQLSLPPLTPIATAALWWSAVSTVGR